jgi:hypothetical protein
MALCILEGSFELLKELARTAFEDYFREADEVKGARADAIRSF